MKRLAYLTLLLFLIVATDARAQYFSGSYGTLENVNAEVGISFDSKPATFRTFLGYGYSSRIGNMVNLGVGAEKTFYSLQKVRVVSMADIRLSVGNMAEEMNSQNEVSATGISDWYGGLKLPFNNANLYIMTGMRATPYKNFHYYWIPVSMRLSIH